MSNKNKFKNELIKKEAEETNEKLKEIMLSTNETINKLAAVTQQTFNKVETMDKKLRYHSDEIEQLKYNEEITDQQATYITSLVRSKTKDLVGYPSKYYNKVIHHFYSHLRSYHFMGGKVRTTRKGNYDSVIEGIKLYAPDLEQIKREHDEYLKVKNN